MAGFQAEMADFFVALREAKSTSMLAHLAALRGMSAAEGVEDASLLQELHQACVEQARVWVQQRVPQLVVSFEAHVHGRDRDLLAADHALREGRDLITVAQPEVGDMHESHEALVICERQLLSLLQDHIKRANRHELRMLYADFCQGDGRDGLRELCLEKYKEQVDKHVQTEAVNTLLRVQAILSAGAPAAGERDAGSPMAKKVQDAQPSLVQLFEEYLEDVAQLSEELALAQLPDSFQATALRELEQEACTQLVELLQNVLRLDEVTHAAAEAVADATLSGAANADVGGGACSATHSTLLALDHRLEDASALLLLLHTFSRWCENLQPPLLRSPLANATDATDAAADATPPAQPSDEASAAEVAADVVAAVSACTSALADTAFSSAPPRAPVGAAAEAAAVPSVARRRLEAYAQGVACAYLHAEGTYLHAAVEVATSSEEVADETDPDGPVLSLVDDAFYVLLKSFQRTVRTRSATLVVLPHLNQVVDALRQGCDVALRSRLRDAGDAQPSNGAFTAAANSLECAAHYTERLRQVVLDAFSSQFEELAPMADGLLAELHGLALGFSDGAAEAMARLAGALVPTAWFLLDFGPADFVLDSDLKEAEQQRSFECKLLQPLGGTLRALQPKLRASNMDALARGLALALAERIEQAVMQKRFNELGAMLLSEHVQQLSDTLSEPIRGGSVRKELGRLRQLTFILNAGTVREAVGLLMSGNTPLGGGSSPLSRADAARVLSLRVEFDQGDVMLMLDDVPG